MALVLARQGAASPTKGTSGEEPRHQLEDLSQSSSTFLAQPAETNRVESTSNDVCLSDVRVLKPSMSLRICVGFVVGVLRWEEGWMWEFRSKRTPPSHGFIGSRFLISDNALLVSALSGPNSTLPSHDL